MRTLILYAAFLMMAAVNGGFAGHQSAYSDFFSLVKATAIERNVMPEKPGVFSLAALGTGGRVDFRVISGNRDTPQGIPLEIYDIHGKLVRVLPVWFSGGEGGTAWDFRDGLGRRMGSGIYLARIRLAASRTVSKAFAAIR